MADTEDPLFVQEEIPIRNAAIRNSRIGSVTGQSFEISAGTRSSNGFKAYRLMYDPLGRKARQKKYNREGKMIYEWMYDPKGRLVREIAYEGSGNINYRTESLYNGDDNWREKRVYLSDDSLHYRIVANRNARGGLSEGVYYDSSDQRIRTDSYVYDDRGRLVSISMGHLGEWLYEYDENENLKRKTGHLPSASIFGESFEFQYDDRGLLVQRTHLNYDITVFDYILTVGT